MSGTPTKKRYSADETPRQPGFFDVKERAAQPPWQTAARLYYDLRRQGLTVRSPIDCCIAQIALENRLMLVHDDRDFITISQLVPLQQKQWRIH